MLFIDGAKLREFTSTKPALQQILKCTVRRDSRMKLGFVERNEESQKGEHTKT